MTNQEVKQRLTDIVDFSDKKSINTLSRCVVKHPDILSVLKHIQDTFSLKTIMESVYIVMNDMIEPHKCIDCNEKYTPFLGYHKGYKERCCKCALIHSAKITQSILKNKTDEEKQDIVRRSQLKHKENRDKIIQSLDSDESWKTINRQEIKDYLISYIKNDDTRLKGIGNHLLHKKPLMWKYIIEESKKFGYDDNSVVIYMIINDIETPPLCIDCHTNYASFYRIDGKNQFSERCRLCGLKHGGSQADLSYCEKHGHSFFANTDIHKRISEERFEKKGYYWPMQNPETVAKSLETAQSNNGGTGFASEKVLESINKTCQERYQKDIFELSGTKKFQDKVKNSCIERYGVSSWMKTKEYRDLFHQRFLTESIVDNVKNFLLKYDLELISEYENAAKPIKVKHIPCGTITEISSFNQLQQGIIIPDIVCKHCNPNSGCGKSQKEEEIQKYLETIQHGIKIERNTRKILENRKELDLYLPDYKLAIEYCGLWCHSTNCDAYHSDKVKEPEYHYEKFKRCKELGIRLITIFDNEDLEWYKDLLSKIIHNTEIYNVEKLNLITKDNEQFYFLDNKWSSYDFFPLKNKFDLIEDIPYMANFWKYKEYIREDEFIESYVADKSTDVFELAHNMGYNWIFDCGYQLLKLRM